MTETGKNISVTCMTDDLLPMVVTLEESCGLNSRGVDGYRKMLSNPNSILLVAMPAGTKIPVGIFSAAVVVDEMQIDNIAVSEGCRRQGIGRILLNIALVMAAGLGARSATLEVRSANSSARAFYEKERFTPSGLRKSYYMNPPDDALLLSREI